MKNKIGRLMTRRTISNIIVALCAVLFYVLLNNVPSIRAFFVRIYDIMAPFIWGVVLAYLLNPIVRLLEERVFRFKNRRVAHVLAVIFRCCWCCWCSASSSAFSCRSWPTASPS